MNDYRYDGITAESMFLLSENKFRNSKTFYDENKEKIKQGVIVPLRQIAAALAEDMFECDEKMMLDPTKMVSRVRRDTRFTKDKTLYRDNIWMLFMHSKKDLPYLPAFWFEVQPGSFDCGVGTYATPPRLMELYRKALCSRGDEFLQAARACENAGAVFGGEKYGKEKSGLVNPELREYYSVKSCWFLRRDTDISKLEDKRAVEQARECFRQYRPMYKFLLGVANEYSAEV